MSNFLEAARRVEAGRKLVGERLVVNEAVRASRADCLFVEPLGLDLAAFEARDLCGDQRGAVIEIFGAVLGPFLDLTLVGSQSLQVLGTFRSGCRLAESSPRQCSVEMILRLLQKTRRDPEQLLCLRCSFRRRRIFTGQIPRL